MSEMSKKKVIAITGSMGSGKSQVSKILAEKYPVIDCDSINAELLMRDHKGYKELIKNNLVQLDSKKNIDKIKLSNDMFNDKHIKTKVESILHPLIFEEIERFKEAQTCDLVFVEVPLLFEINAQSHFDSIWCIVSSQLVALQRLEAYRNISQEEALRRLSFQMDPAIKSANSNIVIYNDGSLEELKKEVYKALEKEQSWN